MTDYRSRLSIPCDSGSESLELYNSSGSLLTRGYVRIVIGDRGPYVEFEEKHIIDDSVMIPSDQQDRIHHPDKYYYAELRSKDEAYTKVYYQFKVVNYADYKIGMFYISPFDLYQKKTDGSFEALIEPLRKKSAKSKTD